ncbi:MAG TPA: AAA family ATPase [Acidimicrobiia bacterium]|nr:AAA family ATPase [Acidimicrobiia bacterium]
MASKHEGLNPNRIQRDTRRRADTWDRIKFLLLITLVVVGVVGNEVNPPFVPLSAALSDFFSSTLGRVMSGLFILEIIRQLHYFVSERSARYHGFWQDSMFGRLERGASRLKPWTRFRVARFFRFAIYIAIYAYVADYFMASVESPWEALVGAPRIIASVVFSPVVIQGIAILFFVVMQFVAIFWFLSRGGTDVVMPEEIKTRFSDVWGQDNVLRLIRENIAFLEKPDEIEAKGGYIPGGILLWGPPGTGKTLIAESVAGETGSPFVFVDPGAFQNMFMGVGILKVKSLYRKLRRLSLRHGGVIVFFDEADALGSRGNITGLGTPGMAQPATGAIAGINCNGFSYLSAHSQEVVASSLGVEPQTDQAPPRSLRDRIMMGGMGMGGGMGTLQALLSEMNGLTKPRGVFNKLRKLFGFRPKPPPKYRLLHIMATNMPNSLDEAMLRPGRIDRIYKVGYPSKDGRRTTLEGYLAKVNHELSDEEIERLAVVTPYYSGAKIKDLVNEALIQAIREGRQAVTWPDIWKAKALKELGPPDDAEYIQRERHAVAIHEASHAVIAHLMRRHTMIDLVTIERHGDTGGMVKNLLAEDRFTQWKSEFETDVMVSLASLAGERMFFGDDNSSGVTGDLRSATAVASYMEGVWGMGDQLVSYTIDQTAVGQASNPAAVALQRNSEQINARLDDLYEKTRQLLDEHRDKVLALAAVLEDRKTISGDDVTAIMGTPPGDRPMRQPSGWYAVGDSEAEERRVAALSTLDESEIGKSNGPAGNGKPAEAVETAPET